MNDISGTWAQCGTSAFAVLVAGARANSWVGPEAQELLNEKLPPLVNQLSARFPELDRGDVFNRVLILLDGNLPEGGPSLSWVRACMERELLNAVWSQRDVRCEEKTRRMNFTAERAALRVPTGEALVVRGPAAEAYMEAIPAASSGAAVGVWEELSGLLVRLGWEPEIATRAVEVLETRAERGMVSIPATSRELDFLPKGYRTRLARFAFAKPGYLWARLHGITFGRALADVHENLLGLVWLSSERDTASGKGGARARVSGMFPDS